MFVVCFEYILDLLTYTEHHFKGTFPITSQDAVLKHSVWDFGKLSKEEEVGGGGGGLAEFLPFQLSGSAEYIYILETVSS